MAITTNPLYNLNAIYRPNQFVLEITTVNALEIAKVDVYVDGILITTLVVHWFLNIGNTYYFTVDVSRILRDQSAPLNTQLTTIFNTSLDIPYTGTNVDCHTEYCIEANYEYRDGTTNELTDLGVTDTSSTYEAIISTRQQGEEMGLDDYIIIGPSNPLLNSRPNDTGLVTMELCESENYFVTGVPYLSNAFRIQTFDSSGTPIDTGLATIPFTSDYTPFTFGIGITQLATQAYFDGAVTLPNPNVAFYTFSIGIATLSGSWSFAARSDIFVIYVRDCCPDRDFRLHWMNRLGGAESYTFRNKKTASETNKSSIAQKALGWQFTAPPTFSYSKGRFKTDITGDKKYKLESEYFSPGDGEWLAEILTSPEVYWENNGELYSVLVETDEITKSASNELVKLEVTITLGDPISVQQY